MGMNQIMETIGDIKQAKENLVRIQSDYAEEPELMAFYLPTVKQMIIDLEKHLNYLLGEELDNDFEIDNSYMADLWIRFAGGKIGTGTGPIGAIGAYLQKLNTATWHAASLMEGTKDLLERHSGKGIDLYSFDLVATDKGSLKLGLKPPSYVDLLIEKEQQLELFVEGDPVEQLKDIDEINKLSMRGFELLIQTLNSADDFDAIDNLREKYHEKGVMKLLHYAKELVPSSRSSFDYVYFEGKNIGISSSELKTDKETRKLLIEQENRVKRDTEYISGKGWLRALDLDELTGVLRPFNYKDKNIGKIDFRISTEVSSFIKLDSLLDKFVNIKGFLEYNKNFEPHRIEIEEMFIDDSSDVYSN